MCGIFAYYSSNARNLTAKVLDGLRRLEYRGYDSWGIAVVFDGAIHRYRQVGAVGSAAAAELKRLPQRQTLGVGHTRWATHGGVSRDNAHPHLSTGGDFALVHNGIVENYQALKRTLTAAGHRFTTATDSEVIVRLIEDKLRRYYYSPPAGIENPLRLSVAAACAELQGLNTVLVLGVDDDCLIGVRNGSPLVAGYDEGGVYIASDPLAFADRTQDVSFIEDRQLVELRAGQLRCYDLYHGERIELTTTRLALQGSVDSHTPANGQHFMLKEILEQPRAIAAASALPNDTLDALAELIQSGARLIAVGAGGAFFAAEQIAYYLRTLARVDAQAVAAYELEAWAATIRPNDVLLAVSQSGETADTLDAVRLAARRGARIASLVNMPGATLSRLAEFAFYNNAGPEICVLSTKSAAAQISFGYLLAQRLVGDYAESRARLARLGVTLSAYLDAALLAQVRALAKRLQAIKHVFLLGRGLFYTSARIGALNIKEASYVHAEGFAAGELKHGVIALIETGTPVIAFVDQYHPQPMLNAIAEVKSRGALTVGVAVYDNELFDMHLPLIDGPDNASQAIASLIPCQLLAYYLSVLRGYNPDRPRNLAKSVTVR